MNLNGKIILAAASFVGLTLGIIFFGGFSLVSEIEGVRTEIVAQRNDAAKMDSRILKVRQYREFAKKEESNIKKMEGLLTDRQMPDFIDYLEESAATSGVEVVFSPSISLSNSDEDWPSMDYQADITGDINNILKLVKKIEIGPYLVRVDGFSIEAGINQSGSAAKNQVLDMKWTDPGTAHILLKAYVKK